MSLRSRLILMFLLAVALAQPARATDRIWFAPLPYINSGGVVYTPPPGTQDYWNLFYDNAPWPNGMNRTGVFQMIAQTLDFATDAQLQNAFDFLKRHNIAFALEIGPVTPPSGCVPSPGEGYGNLSQTTARMVRIKNLGGELAYIAMDEPYLFAEHWAGGACQLSPTALADNIINGTRAVVLGYFPNAKFGDTEAFVHLDNEPNLAANFGAFLDRWQSVTGTPLEFVHNEGDVELAAWQSSDSTLRPVLDARNIKYGIIWHGMNAGANNNHDWVQTALWRINVYRGLVPTRTLPDQHIFETWDGYPTLAMPDTNPDTHSSLLNNAMNVLTNVDTPTSMSHWPGGWIGGWTIDRAANKDPGIDTIHVWNISTVPATFVGVVTLGADRWDVAGVFGSQFRYSGWNIYVPAQPLYGPNVVCFYPHSTVHGNFAWDRVTCITINEY